MQRRQKEGSGCRWEKGRKPLVAEVEGAALAREETADEDADGGTSSSTRSSNALPGSGKRVRDYDSIEEIKDREREPFGGTVEAAVTELAGGGSKLHSVVLPGTHSDLKFRRRAECRRRLLRCGGRRRNGVWGRLGGTIID